MTPARRMRPGPIDWTQVRERLARVRTADAGSAPPSARTGAILAERARLLARRPAEAHAPAGTIETLTFVLGSERYAIDTRYVQEVSRLVDVTPVPGTPAFVVGLTNHRGQLLCLMDLRSIIGTPVTPLADVSQMIVLGDPTPEFAVLAGRADEIRPLRPDEILPPPAGSSEHLLGVTRQALLVIDGASLLRSPRLHIDQREGE